MIKDRSTAVNLLLRYYLIRRLVLKKDILLFRLSCVLFAISSLSMLLSFFGDYNGSAVNVVLAVLTGALFWAGLISGGVLMVLLNRRRKRNEKKQPCGFKEKICRIGAFSFFKNRLAMVADIAMLVLFELILVTVFIPVISQDIILIFMVLFVLSVYMHCVFNGVNYIYIKSINEE